jgi:hypothetical protein
MLTRERGLALALVAAAVCDGCGEREFAAASDDAPVVPVVPPAGHTWDTEDPDAGMAPSGIIVIGIVLVLMFVLLGGLRRGRAARPRTTAGGRAARSARGRRGR